MKVSNLFVPIMALTALTNNPSNNQIAIRFEKELSIPHEIFSRDYFVNQNIFEKVNNMKPVSHSEAGCEALYQSVMATCASLTGFKKIACHAAAKATYLACLAGPGGSSESI